MLKRVIIGAIPMILLLAVPLLLRPHETLKPSGTSTEKLVIITPHTEPIKYEFTVAFRRFYRERYGTDIEIDWRNVGGTADIVRHVNDRYEAAFRRYYEAAGGNWNRLAAESFRDARLDAAPDTSGGAVRQRFTQSEVGIGIDLFFGGGVFDHARFAAMGYGVDAGIRERRPEYFVEEIIPARFAGEQIYDPQGRFYGVCLSTFGIAKNLQRIGELGDAVPPLKTWQDLTHPGFFQQIAIADPTKSGSINKCFEMILQQAIAEQVAATPTCPDAVETGWSEGFLRIKLLAANSRYATDSASSLVRDISAGQAAAGMCIDFYGLSEEEWTNALAEEPRIRYLMPENGTAVAADPIQLLRGAPNRRAAVAFIEFSLSREGQKLWMLKPGTPGGPRKYALRRPPVRRDLYHDETLREYRSDPDYNPYLQIGTFVYRAEWTGRYFNLIRVLIKTLALDPMDELQAAWRAIVANGGPERNPAAMAALAAMPFSYERASEAARKLYPSESVSLADTVATRRAWTEFAVKQYREARRLAREPAASH